MEEDCRKRRKDGRGKKETMVAPPVSSLDRADLVHRLAIHGWLR